MSNLVDALPAQPSLSLEEAIKELPFDLPTVGEDVADAVAPLDSQDARSDLSDHRDDPSNSAPAEASFDHPLNGEASSNT